MARSDSPGTPTPPDDPAEATVEPASQDAAAPVQTPAEIPADADPAQDMQAPFAPAQAATAVPAHHRGGSGGAFVAGFLGGALAIAVGVGALWLSNPDLLRGKAPEADFTPLTARLDGQQTDLARLSEALAQAEGRIAPRLEALDGQVSTLSEGLDAVRGQFEALAARPPSETGDAAPASQALADLRADLDRQRAALDALVAENRSAQAAAEEATRAIAARSALTRIEAALEAGGPFAATLEELSQAGAVPIPAELTEVAATGVAMLADLREGFPDAARAALAASVRAGLPEDAGAMDRIGAFLRAQTGARSTAPREGGDADAILSRAEAALAAGDLAGCLRELDALPEAGRAEMAPWRAAAEARLAALSAAQTLSAALSAN